MRIRTIVLVIIALFIIVPSTALFAAESAQYNKPSITVHNGVASIETSTGTQTLESVYENDLTVPDQKITGYKGSDNSNTPVLPVVLPGTSAPHGVNSCTLTSGKNTFIVTTDESCDTLK